MKNYKKLSTLILSFFILISSFTISFAEMSDKSLETLKTLDITFKKNIYNISDYDTKAGNKWELNVSPEIVKEEKVAMKFLQGVYAVVPFFNAMSVSVVGNKYTISLENLSSYENKKVIEIAKKWTEESITTDMTDLEKIKALHDKIIKETEYDQSNREESHSPGAVAIEKKAVCDGYSRMFSIMLTIIDIPVIQVTSNTMDHAFNLVYLEGRWYLVDVTYDDPLTQGKNVVRYNYFMIDPTTSLRHKYDTSDKGMTLEEYITLGNYIYKDEIAKTKKVA